ncbi:hypothetical protein J3R82DRAFT_8436 [Butyriboletus roseoflavus]|nr:hypothetical protein J3R82DRAFT_8436 [Butyriboletus roseoflavus]
MNEARRPQGTDQVKRHHTLQDSLYHLVELAQGHLNEIHDEDSNNPNDALTRWLNPLVDRLRGIDLPPDDEEALRICVEENVKFQVDNLTRPQFGAFVKKSAKTTPVWVHGWVYDFSTGFIRDLEITKVVGEDDD